MLESIEKLRGYAPNHPELYAVCNAAADAIEAEIAERYMELPVGKDGKPLRFGETVYGKDGRAWVVRSYKPAPYSVRVSAADNGTDKRHVKAGWMTHEKPRTIEDVLREFAHKAVRIGMKGGVPSDVELYADDDAVAEYADEIRKVVGE